MVVWWQIVKLLQDIVLLENNRHWGDIIHSSDWLFSCNSTPSCVLFCRQFLLNNVFRLHAGGYEFCCTWFWLLNASTVHCSNISVMMILNTYTVHLQPTWCQSTTEWTWCSGDKRAKRWHGWTSYEVWKTLCPDIQPPLTQSTTTEQLQPV